MNLPERRSDSADAETVKPGIRPRPMQTRELERAAHTKPLLFSCPSCREMMTAMAGAGGVDCPVCGAQVMPPRVVAPAKVVKGQMAPLKKSGVVG